MELIITVVILGVIAGLALPNISFNIEKSKSAEGVEILTALLSGQRAYEIDHPGIYAQNLTDLDVTIPASANFNLPEVFNNISPVARLTRSTGTYELLIDATGHISCNPLSSQTIC